MASPDLTPKPICPLCGSQHVVKNGRIHNKKPKYQCQTCRRQFIEHPTKKVIDQPTKDLIDKMLLEKISLAGIARVLEVSMKWLQDYVNQKYSSVPQQINVSGKSQGKIVIECDEAWSFVGNKGNQQWIWLSLDRQTREIVGCYVGARTRESAQKLWESLPPVYRQCATCYTDFWSAYEQIIPSKRHKAVGKESGQTNHIERFNNTLRQRISRLVRKTLSFSKKLNNHVGAIWYFIHYYNASLAS